MLSFIQLSIKDNCCLRTSLSYIFHRTGKIAIGLKSSLFLGASVLGIGEILDIFQASGKMLDCIQVLIIYVRGAAIIYRGGGLYTLFEFDQDPRSCHFEGSIIL